MSTATAVREKPILFSAPMVRALLAGTKTQTRRVVKPQPVEVSSEYPPLIRFRKSDPCLSAWNDACPYGCLGDRLWVRETFNALIDPGARKQDVRRKVWNEEEKETEYWVVDYQADGPHNRIMDQTGSRRWQPSIHMPRWASRITLEITDVRVERLQSISEDDAIAEGIEYTGDRIQDGKRCSGSVSVVGCFRELWHTIHKADGPHGWDASPWVWCISFRRIVQ